MNKDCFPKPIATGPCKAVPVVFLSTEIAGVDDEQYPPENGAYRNTIVTYTKTKHVYIYDSAGIPTRTNYEGVIDEVLNIESKNPVENRAITKAIADTAEALQTNINLEVMDRESDRDNLQANINKLYEKETEDANNLQTNINKLADKEAEDVADVNQRIDDIINSPDVRYIVGTYAELEEIDKSTIGDQDYARVLQDETHDGASTYYQFIKTASEWVYVGQTGPYYTKEQADEKFSTPAQVTEVIDTAIATAEANADDKFATKEELNEVVGNINTALQTLISGTGAN